MSEITSSPADKGLHAVQRSVDIQEDPQPIISSSEKRKFKLGSKAVESISGLSAGLITTLVSHPLDFLKLRLQLDTKSSSHKEGFLKIRNDLLVISTDPNTNKIKYKNLIREIYRGIGPNLLGSTTAWSLYFMFYREYKNLLHNVIVSTDEKLNSLPNIYQSSQHGDRRLNSVHYLICGFAAGWSTSLLTNPIWVIKTRMISTSSTSPDAYHSILDGLKSVYKNEGIRGYYKGLSPALVSVSQGAIQFSLYDTFKQYLIQKNTGHTTELTTFQYLYTSATSKMISTVLLYPLQVVRSRLQINKEASSHTTMWQVSKQLVKGEGIKGFYKGVGANMIRVLPATCITFSVYENMRKYLT